MRENGEERGSCRGSEVGGVAREWTGGAGTAKARGLRTCQGKVSSHSRGRTSGPVSVCLGFSLLGVRRKRRVTFLELKV